MIDFFDMHRKSIVWGLLVCFALFLHASGTSIPRSDERRDEGVSLEKASDSPGTLEVPGNPAAKSKKKKSILPVIVVLVVVAVAGYYGYKLVTKKEKFNLTVTLPPGVTGTPAAGTHSFEKGTKVDFSYTSSQLFNVTLDGNAVGQKGSIDMYANHAIDATTTESVREDFSSSSTLSIYWQPRNPAEWNFWGYSYNCDSNADNWNYNLFNYAWPRADYDVTAEMLCDRFDCSYGLLLATSSDMSAVSGYYIGWKNRLNVPGYRGASLSYSIWKLSHVDLARGTGSFSVIHDWKMLSFTPDHNEPMNCGFKIVRRGNRYEVREYDSYNKTDSPIGISFTDASYDTRYFAFMFDAHSTQTKITYRAFYVD